WNGTVYVAGIMPSNPHENTMMQTRNVLEEIDRRLAAAGTDKSRLLSATIWLLEPKRDLAAMNKAWSEWLTPGCKPARACVRAELNAPSGVLEIAVIAAVPSATQG